jgi:signal transduction histidine kinase
VIAAYGAAVHSPYQQAAAVSAVVGGALALSRLAASFATLPAWLIMALFLVPVGLAANAIHTWRQRARSLEAEQEIAARLAVSKERSRIARELHDVVTHNVSVMVIQAGAARMVLPDDPGRAVEDGGRAALTELRHVMGLLAMDGETLDEAELSPQPGLDRLDALAARIRASGVPIELAVTGEPTELPPGVELTAYRVVQEAVTNTIKHAEGASVSIRVQYAPEALHVEVTDTGGAPTATARTGNGRGLTGLRERLALYDGVLEAGPRPTAGFRVRATVPLVTP